MSAVPGQFTGAGGGPLQSSGDQYLRKWALRLGPNAAGDNLVLSTSDQGYDLRIKFQIRQSDIQTPNTAIIRVYNLSDETALKAVQEYTTVSLEAGYINGRFGVIFAGVVKQYKVGHESPVDNYLDIFAADGVIEYNSSTINKTLAAPVSPITQYNQLTQAWQQSGLTIRPDPSLTDYFKTGILPRDRVNFGATADETALFARNREATWSIVNGQFQFTPRTAYEPGDIVVITPLTGQVNFPEATQDGVEVPCLLNPSIRIRQRIQLDNKSINFYYAPGRQGLSGQSGTQFPGYKTGITYYANPARDGIYVCLVIDYDGDSRGLPWYNRLVCVAVEPEQPPTNSVKLVSGLSPS